jgi:hypothetical protein
MDLLKNIQRGLRSSFLFLLLDKPVDCILSNHRMALFCPELKNLRINNKNAYLVKDIKKACNCSEDID